ncbi:MAG: hypothetical protein R3C05_07750 [Pirellulaceae bacterium]
MPHDSLNWRSRKSKSTTKRHRLRRSIVETLETRQMLAADNAPMTLVVDDASDSPTNSGLIVAANPNNGFQTPLNNLNLGGSRGFDGVAHDSQQRLWGTTSVASGPSDLVELDRISGEVLSALSLGNVDIDDLAYDVAGDRLLGVSQDSRLYAIDRQSGSTALIASLPMSQATGLAYSESEGILLTGIDGLGNNRLYRLDAAGQVVSSTMISGSIDIVGLGFDPQSGRLYASDAAKLKIVWIDTATGSVVDTTLDPPKRGIYGDLAFTDQSRSYEVLFEESFDSSSQSFTFDNSGGVVSGYWHPSLGRSRDGLINHTPPGSIYYGRFETAFGGGDYVLPYQHQGVAISPEISIPAEGVTLLNFNYLLDTRPSLSLDQVEVRIDDGESVTPILTRASGSLPQTGRDRWLTATADLTAYAGKTIQIQYYFNTLDELVIDPEGWFVDDVMVVHQPVADISVLKTVSDATPNPGETVSYTLTATNHSTLTTATDVQVRDVLPTGLLVQGTPSPSQGVFDPSTGLWNGFELAPGETATLTIDVVIPTDARGIEFCNVADISSILPDPDASNNRSTACLTTNEVDVSVVKSVNVVETETVRTGQSLTYTITVGNAASSNAAATNVTVSELLPEGLTLDAANPPVFPEGRPVEVDPGSGMLQWRVGELAIGESVTLVLSALVDGGQHGKMLANTACASFDEEASDPDTINNCDTATITVEDEVDLEISKAVTTAVDSDGDGTADATEGDFVIYTLTARNVSAADSAMATGVVVTDTLPPELQPVRDSGGMLVAPTASTGTATITQVPLSDPPRFVIRWEGFTLASPTSAGAAGEEATLRFAVRIADDTGAKRLVNSAEISSEQDDPDPSNNTASASVDVAALVQFVMPITNFRSGPIDFVTPPATTGPTISGHKWYDINMDGVWDNDEDGLAGYAFYLDLNNDQTFDPDENEPIAVTDEDGRYVFTAFADGTPLTDREYIVREERSSISAATFGAYMYPAAANAHAVDIENSESKAGVKGNAESLNFGVFEYVPYLRPSDDLPGHLDFWGPGNADQSLYELTFRSFEKWQRFSITNTTDATLTIDGFDVSGGDSLICNMSALLKLTLRQTFPCRSKQLPCLDGQRRE